MFQAVGALVWISTAHAALLPVPHGINQPAGSGLSLAGGMVIRSNDSPDARPGRYLADQLAARHVTLGAGGAPVSLVLEGGTATGAAAHAYRLSVARDGITIP